MAETVREVNYYYITASNKPGEGAALASLFKDAGVSLLAMHAFPVSRRVQVDFVPEDARAFTTFARKAKLKLSPRKKAFLVEGTDRTGALVRFSPSSPMPASTSPPSRPSPRAGSATAPSSG